MRRNYRRIRNIATSSLSTTVNRVLNRSKFDLSLSNACREGKLDSLGIQLPVQGIPNAGTSFRFSTLIIVPLVIFFTIIAIGLIAVGPEGVWDEVKNLLPSLFEEKL